MMKKLLLFSLFVSLYEVRNIEAVLRESNRVKVDRADMIGDALSCDIHAVKTLRDAQTFFRSKGHYNGRIQDSYEEIATRYNGIAPWNWGKKMKNSYKKMNFLSALFEYKDVITHIDILKSERSIIKYMKRQQGSHTYPLLDIASDLRDAISRLKYSRYACILSDIVVENLSYVLFEIVSSYEYTNELRLQEIEKLQKEQLAQTQRMAQAAERSARALEEGNRLKKEESSKESVIKVKA